MVAPLDDADLAMMQNEIALTQDLTGQDGVTQARKVLQDSVVYAARSVVNLALHADKESVRFSAAVYIIERQMGRIQDDPPAPVDDPYIDIVEKCLETIESTPPEVRTLAKAEVAYSRNNPGQAPEDLDRLVDIAEDFTMLTATSALEDI